MIDFSTKITTLKLNKNAKRKKKIGKHAAGESCCPYLFLLSLLLFLATFCVVLEETFLVGEEVETNKTVTLQFVDAEPTHCCRVRRDLH